MDDEQRFKASDGENFDRAMEDERDSARYQLLEAAEAERFLKLEIAARDEEIEKLKVIPVCEWSQNSDGAYETQCGNAWKFENGTATENGALWCIFCRGKILDKACEIKVNDKRDPEHPCECFTPGEPGIFGNCYGDGHYLCLECEEYVPPDEEEEKGEEHV